MLTTIGRASAQRVLARGSALAAHRMTTIPLRFRAAIVASRSFTTSPWGQLATKASSTKTAGTKKKTTTPTKKKTATKKAVKKKAAPKPKPKKKVKKALTPEQKLKEDIKKYKAAALLDGEPKKLPDTPWRILTVEGVKPGPESIGSKLRAVSSEYRSLSGFRKQELQEQAEKNKLENNAAYKAWVERHTPREIYDANVARRRLRLKLKTRGSAYRPAIRDERLPKRGQGAYTMFCTARWNEGGLTGGAQESAKQLGREWKELSADQKKVYEDLAAAENERYRKEMLNVLGIEVKLRSPSP